MDFRELSGIYNLDFSGLGKILKKKGIVLNLEHLNDIPEAWIPIIEDSLGLIPLKAEVKESKLKRSPSQIENVSHSLPNKSLKSSEVVSQNQHSTTPSESKPQSHNQLDSYSSGRINKTKLSNIRKYTRTSSKKPKKCFYAYVKFVGQNKDHAFIRIYKDINLITYKNANLKDDQSYKLAEDCSRIMDGQIILVDIRNENYKLASIVETSFIGTFISGYQNTFVDWISLKKPLLIENIKGSISNVEDLFVSVSLKYSSTTGIYCESSDRKLYQEMIGPIIKDHFITAISNRNAPHKTLILAFKKIISDTFFHDEVKAKFLLDAENKGYLENDETFDEFVEKWNAIDPSVLTYNNMDDEGSKSIYFDLWLKNKLPLEFWGEQLIDNCVTYESNMYKSDSIVLLSKLQKTHIEIVSSALEIYFNSDVSINNVNEFKVVSALVLFSNLTSKENLNNQLHSMLSPKLRFELWLGGEEVKFDKEIAIEIFPNSNPENQERILSELEDINIGPLFPYITEVQNSDLEKRLYNLLLNSISNRLDFICFDLESNGKDINEIGWVDNENSENLFSEFNDIPIGIDVFKKLSHHKDKVFVGHNIVQWDLPILSKFEISIPQEQIWDTLLIEAFLSPEFKNYALITAHNATDDAKLTRELFLNQFCRILYLQEEKLIHLFSYLPSKIVEKIKKLKAEIIHYWKPLDLLLSERTTFFRPQPKPNTLIEQVKAEISNASSNNILIIGSSDFKNEIIEIENIKFHSDKSTEKNYYKLDKSKIEQIDDIHIWVKHVLLNFVDYNNSLNKPSFWGQLPTSVKIQVENTVNDVFELFYPNEIIEWSFRNVLFFTIPELLLYQEQLKGLKNIDLMTVQNDLISVENKKVLKEISLDILMNQTKNDDHIWLNFSGGQSIAELSLEQCKDLKVEIPKLFDNIWIEKITLNKFNICGNYDWEKLVGEFHINSRIDIQSSATNFETSQVIITEVSAIEALKSKVIRFNPESFYRSRYWVFQKQLVDQIVIQKKPTVLIIQRYDEIEVLQNYFSHLGYYVPDHSISIGRRLELLHQNKSTYKLIIEHVSNLDRIIQANYVDSLNIIFDSFNLSENYYAAVNSRYFKSLNSKRLKRLKELEEDDTEITANNNLLNTSKKPVISDTFFLLELLKPRVSHIRNLLQNADPNHKLWLLDPRLNDYNGLHKAWNASISQFKVWKDFEAYEAAVKEADIHIDSVKPMEELPFDKEKIKEILQQVFLKDFNWRKSQIPYLDLIIEGKEDQLITLPTGEGKSVLFQGPALFKGAFTNKLSIVVTPLKALMEDQVDALWNKGFFGSVDYINSDRSSDVDSIYRALAGGELSLLFVTPERFRSRSFNNALQMRIQSDGGLEYGIFDEAHCVSQWGHEFRPDYFNCAKRIVKLKKLSSNKFPLLLFSATVSEKIYNDFNTIFS